MITVVLLISLTAIVVAAHTYTELANLRQKHDDLVAETSVILMDHDHRIEQIEESLCATEEDFNDDSN
jgi:hypothetical protein